MKLFYLQSTRYAFLVLTITACLSMTAPGVTTQVPAVEAIFEGTTPCGLLIRPLHRVPQNADCALVNWKLTLYKDPVNSTPTTYTLESMNRYVMKETNLYSTPATRHTITGKWTRITGTDTKPQAKGYRLDPDKPDISVSFIKMSDEILHLLDKKGNLMNGNPFWSYTLNRTNQ